MKDNKHKVEKQLKRFADKHGTKYEYPDIFESYKNTRTKIKIICPEHGAFTQLPANHGMGQGCPKCGDLILPPQNEVRCWDTVEKKFREKHGDKYTYIKDTYINAREKMTIVCPVHGRFEQTPASHLIGGCKKCGYDNRIKPWAEVEKMFRKVHGDRYQYNSSTYQKCEVNMTIICPEHGSFLQTPNNHRSGQGCRKCGLKAKNSKNTNPWEKMHDKFIKLHGDLYTYKPNTYTKTKNKMTIVCPTHGEFEQTPDGHAAGKGCHICAASKRRSKGEDELMAFVKSIKQNAEQSNDIILKPQEIDIFVPDLSVGIEYCGEYHHSESMERGYSYHLDVL